MRANAAFQVFRRVGAVFCGLLLMAFTSLVLYAVIMRYVFSAPPMWGEELPAMLFIWLIFIGAGFAYIGGINLRVTVLIDLVPNRPRRIIELVMHGGIVVMLVMILWYSVPIIRLTSGTISLATGISDGWKFWALPLGALLLLVNELWRIARLLRGAVDEAIPLGER